MALETAYIFLSINNYKQTLVTRREGQPRKESSSQPGDKWELAICVTEVPRSQPELTQLYTPIIKTIHMGPLPKCLRVGTSGQHVRQPCSFCSSCSCRKTTCPPTVPCTDGILGCDSQTQGSAVLIRAKAAMQTCTWPKHAHIYICTYVPNTCAHQRNTSLHSVFMCVYTHDRHIHECTQNTPHTNKCHPLTDCTHDPPTHILSAQHVYKHTCQLPSRQTCVHVLSACRSMQTQPPASHTQLDLVLVH